MQIGAGFVALALAAVLMAPSASNAGDIRIGGKGPRVKGHDGRNPSASGQPVVILVDDLADFGQPRTALAPPLVIQVTGDVEIVPLENGGIRIDFVEK